MRCRRQLPIAGCVLLASATAALAQEPPLADGVDVSLEAADRAFAEAMAAESAAADQPEAVPAAARPAPRMNLLELVLEGGLLMIPIGFMSIVVVAFGLERAMALRRRRIIPRGLVSGLEQLASRPGGLDPRQAYRLCHDDRSVAARVFCAALLKVGRPLVEIEHALASANEREAAKLYKNVRPLNLATAITPLIGLLGTVLGMIQAFIVTASSPLAVNRAESLASGIYQALVTTFAGLSVAIPAAILAHYFEGRIENLFRSIDELVQGLMPQFERYEGKLRGGQLAEELNAAARGPLPDRVVAPPRRGSPARASEP